MGSLPGLDGRRLARSASAEDSVVAGAHRRAEDRFDAKVAPWAIPQDILSLDWRCADRMAMPELKNSAYWGANEVFFLRFGLDGPTRRPLVAVVRGSASAIEDMFSQTCHSAVGAVTPPCRCIAVRSEVGTDAVSCLRSLARAQVEWHMPAALEASARRYLMVSELVCGNPLASLRQSDAMELFMSNDFMSKLGAILAVDVLLNDRSRIRVDATEANQLEPVAAEAQGEAAGTGFAEVFGSVLRGANGALAGAMLTISHSEWHPLEPETYAYEDYIKHAEALCVEISGRCCEGGVHSALGLSGPVGRYAPQCV
jgi:hypothetical protein